MNLSRILAVTCFGLLLLPLIFAHAQGPTEKKPRDIIDEWHTTVRSPGKLADRKKAIEELAWVAERLQGMVDTFAVHGLRDPDPDIRLQSARGLSQIGPRASSAIFDLVRVVKDDKIPDVRMAAITALGNILWEGSNPHEAKRVVQVLAHSMRHDGDTHV